MLLMRRSSLRKRRSSTGRIPSACTSCRRREGKSVVAEARDRSEVRERLCERMMVVLVMVVRMMGRSVWRCAEMVVAATMRGRETHGGCQRSFDR
eukprot:2237336-Rhodomonas_salina.1